MNKIFEWIEDDDNKVKVGWTCLAISLACGVLSAWFESPKLMVTGSLFLITSVIVAVAAD